MIRGTVVSLWGGPEDGADLYMPPGELPERLGVHRTRRGELVGVRGHALHGPLEALPLYSQVRTGQVAGTGLAWLTWTAGDARHPVYVHAELLQRWTASHPGDGVE